MNKILPRAAGVGLSGARLFAVSLLALVGGLAARSGYSAPAVPLAVYGHLPNLENVALSPDGTRLAYVRTQGDLRIIAVVRVADHKMIGWVNTGQVKLRYVAWADNDNLMFTTSLTTSVFGFKGEWFLLRVYNVSRNKLRTLPGDPPGASGASKEAANAVVGPMMVRHIDGHTVIFVPGLYQLAYGSYSDDDHTLFRCDLTTGITSVDRTGGPHTFWWVDGQGRLVIRYWDRFFGVSGSSDPVLAAISPIRHVDAVKAPVLLIHGRDDTVVPYEQSQLMYDALRRQHKDVQLVTLAKEDHWLSRSDTRMQMLAATVAFLREHNPPD